MGKQIPPFTPWHGVVPETSQLLLPLGITAGWQLCPGSQGSSTPSAKATDWHIKVQFPPCWIPHKAMFKTIGKFSLLRNHFSSHWQQQNSCRTPHLRIWDTQHPELLPWLCHLPAVAHRANHLTPPCLHPLPRASSADAAVPIRAEVWQCSGAWISSFHQDMNPGVLVSRSVTGGSSTRCLPLNPWVSSHFGAQFEASDCKCSPHSLFLSSFHTQVITQAAFSGNS